MTAAPQPQTWTTEPSWCMRRVSVAMVQGKKKNFDPLESVKRGTMESATMQQA